MELKIENIKINYQDAKALDIKVSFESSSTNKSYDGKEYVVYIKNGVIYVYEVKDSVSYEIGEDGYEYETDFKYVYILKDITNFKFNEVTGYLDGLFSILDPINFDIVINGV